MDAEEKAEVEETTKDSLKYDMNEIESDLLDKVLTECMKNDKVQNDSSGEILRSSVSLMSEEEEFYELMMKCFQMKKHTYERLMYIEGLDDISSS